MDKRRVEDILYDESFKKKKCDKIKSGINQNKVQLHSKNKLSRVYLGELKLHFIPG